MILITFLKEIALPIIGLLISFIIGYILWILGTKIKERLSNYKRIKEIERILPPSERYKIYMDVRDYIIKSDKKYFVFICNKLREELAKRNISIYYQYKYYYLLQELFPELSLIKPKDKKYGKAWWPKEDKQSRIKALDKMIYATLQKDNKL